jgi:hypothetical protein
VKNADKQKGARKKKPTGLSQSLTVFKPKAKKMMYTKLSDNFD